jgi:tRNA A-37 threonylcarbamoyl transferase component Bud32
MANTNYICNRIDQKTNLYYMVKPDPQLVQLTCQLFKPAVSLDADTQFDQKFKLINRLPLHRLPSFSEVYSFKHNEAVYYAKKYIVTTLEQSISQFCKKPKGIRAITVADQLTSLGIKVPESVCVISRRHSSLNKENIYLTKEYAGISLDYFIVKNIDQSKEKVLSVLSNLTTELSTFYKNRFRHHDPALHNFLVKEDGEVAFIDLNAVYQTPVFSLNQVLKNLALINASFFVKLTANKLSHLYTQERVLYYLRNVLKFHMPHIDFLEAYVYLTRKTMERLMGRKSLITPDSFFGQIRL